MASTTSTQQELQDQFLATVRKSQEIALDAIRTMVDTIQTITPKVPSVDLPFADRLPRPQDVVASGYDFRTAVYDKAGQPLATADRDPAVIVTEVDLNERLLWPWLGDWRARIWREGPARADGRP